MTSQAEALYQLQQIDLTIIESRKRLDAIQQELQNDLALTNAQAQVTQAEEALKPLRVKSRDLELELESNTQKAQTSEERLYSGLVKNPKEMQDIQNEVDSLKKRNAQLEDQALELLMRVEEAEQALSEAQAQLEQVQAESSSQHQGLITEQTTLKDTVKQSISQREGVLKRITPSNQDIYKTLRPKKANRPVSLLSGDSCSTCGVEQTMEIANAARRQETLVYCENCGRILVTR
jgi:predicted  nucleic acid-binding Zn-ribbon protein